jgi:PAS domain S-box-containing protein
MIATTQTFSQPAANGADKSITSSVTLAHVEEPLPAIMTDQTDPMVDPSGKTCLLRSANEQLWHSERHLQILIDSIADVITVVNRGGTILSQSPAVTKVLGYESKGLIGTSIFAYIHPDDLAQVYSAFFNVIEGILEHTTVQFRHRISDGTFRIIEAAVGRLNDATSRSVVLSLRPVPLSPSSDTEAIPPSTEFRVSEETTQRASAPIIPNEHDPA